MDKKTRIKELKRYSLPEIYRTYHFPNNQSVRLEYPREIIISDSGNHRVKTRDGKLHIIPTGWLHIEFETKTKDWTI